ncbi:GspH/FimT family pseudopilin [Deferrisoma sp.]
MLALAILALAGGVAIPYFLSTLPSRRVSAAARQVLADLRAARALAVERGVPAYVRFDPGASAYQVLREADGAPGPTAGDPVERSVSLGKTYRNVVIGSRIAADPVTFADDTAVFRPRGTANGGSVYLRAVGHDGIERKVTVLSTTGRVRAYVWNPSTGEWE